MVSCRLILFIWLAGIFSPCDGLRPVVPSPSARAANPSKADVSKSPAPSTSSGKTKADVSKPPAPDAKLSFTRAIGAQPPLGLWDPLGLLKDADQARFDRLRQVELKHGRISMLAVLGHLVTTAGYRLDGYLGLPGNEVPFTNIDNGLAALYGPHAMPYAGVIQLIIFIGALDLGFTNYAEPGVAAKCDEIMTNLGWGASPTSYTKRLKQSIELNNGRAAQMGILGLMVHEKLDNNPYIINSLLGVPVPFNLH